MWSNVGEGGRIIIIVFVHELVGDYLRSRHHPVSWPSCHACLSRAIAACVFHMCIPFSRPSTFRSGTFIILSSSYSLIWYSSFVRSFPRCRLHRAAPCSWSCHIVHVSFVCVFVFIRIVSVRITLTIGSSLPIPSPSSFPFRHRTSLGLEGSALKRRILSRFGPLGRRVEG